jgi:hypothetical protein
MMIEKCSSAGMNEVTRRKRADKSRIRARRRRPRAVARYASVMVRGNLARGSLLEHVDWPGDVELHAARAFHETLRGDRKGRRRAPSSRARAC